MPWGLLILTVLVYLAFGALPALLTFIIVGFVATLLSV